MEGIELYIILAIIFIWFTALTVYVILLKLDVTLLDAIKNIPKAIKGKNKLTEKEEIENIMRIAGYDYDVNQDIFYSRADAWQGHCGYCRLYDEAAPSLGMIIDSEPIYFEYDNKKWLIEFWKGQYGLCTGAEVGVYRTENNDDNFFNIFNVRFYKAITDESDINIKFLLYKNGKKIFTREGQYWWITGFVLGEYSEPEELSMNIEIEFKNEDILKAFLNGLRSAGYIDEEFEVSKTVVKLKFEEPKTSQPKSRVEKMDKLQRLQNKILCDHYKSVINPELNSFDNLVSLKEIDPDMFEKIIDIFKNHELLDIYDSIKKYIE